MNTQWVWRNNAILKERSTKGHGVKQIAPVSPVPLTFHKKTMSSSDIPRRECTSSILNSPEAACLHQILKLAPETSMNAVVAFPVDWGEGGLIRSLGCRDSMFLASYSLYFWEWIQRSLVKSSFSPAFVTQWVNAGLKSHWLLLSDSWWQLEGEYWSFSVGLWWSLCE